MAHGTWHERNKTADVAKRGVPSQFDRLYLPILYPGRIDGEEAISNQVKARGSPRPGGLPLCHTHARTQYSNITQKPPAPFALLWSLFVGLTHTYRPYLIYFACLCLQLVGHEQKNNQPTTKPTIAAIILCPLLLPLVSSLLRTPPTLNSSNANLRNPNPLPDYGWCAWSPHDISQQPSSAAALCRTKLPRRSPPRPPSPDTLVLFLHKTTNGTRLTNILVTIVRAFMTLPNKYHTRRNDTNMYECGYQYDESHQPTLYPPSPASTDTFYSFDPLSPEKNQNRQDFFFLTVSDNHYPAEANHPDLVNELIKRQTTCG